MVLDGRFDDFDGDFAIISLQAHKRAPSLQTAACQKNWRGRRISLAPSGFACRTRISIAKRSSGTPSAEISRGKGSVGNLLGADDIQLRPVHFSTITPIVAACCTAIGNCYKTLLATALPMAQYLDVSPSHMTLALHPSNDLILSPSSGVAGL
jgi:hypothetical protein